MSTRIEVFIGTIDEMSELVSEIEQLLGLNFRLFSEDGTKIYQYSSEALIVNIVDADNFSNDRDLLFENYRYYVSISAIGFKSWQEQDEIRDNFARNVFDKLKATEKYSLLMVRDMQEKLDQYDPPC